jgi:hypothetical protein
MFANPKRGLHYLNIFRNWLNEDLLFSTLVLTGEFLFSGNLPGQHTARFYAPTLITPDHFDDVDDMIAEVSKKGKTQALGVLESDIQKAGLSQSEVNTIIKQYNETGISAPQFLERLGKVLPQAIMQLLEGPLAEVQQWRRLFDTDRVVRADAMRWFDKDLLEPSERIVSDWEKRLYAANRSSRQRTNIIRDARSVAQLFELNKDAPDRMKYVLVTGDSAIRIAYNDYRREEIAARREPMRLYLGRPHEYAPLLNLGAMNPQDKRLPELFPKIEEALNKLLIGMASERRGNDEPPKLEDAPAYLGAEGQTSDEKIDGLRKLWAEVANTSIQINIRYFSARDEAFFSSLSEVLSRANVVEAAIEQFNRVIGKLSEAHIRFAFQGILARHHLDEPEKSEFRTRRAPLQIGFEPFKSIIGSVPINEFLDKLYSGQAEVPIAKLMEVPNYGLLYLFGACVAMASEQWKIASSFAERALNLISTDPNANEDLLNESRYCRAITLRFVVSTEDEFRAAENLLAESIDYYQKRNNRFGVIRSKSELAALIRVFIYKKRIMANPIPGIQIRSDVNLDALWKESLRYLEEAEATLDDLDKKILDRSPRLFSRLANQIYANKAALWIYASWLSPRLRAEAKASRVQQDLDELLNRINASLQGSDQMTDVFYIGQVFAVILQFILANEPEKKRHFSNQAKELIDRIQRQRRRIVDYDLAEMNFFLSCLDTEPLASMSIT